MNAHRRLREFRKGAIPALFFVVVLFVLNGNAQTPSAVSLLPFVSVDGEILKLRDVATITGDDTFIQRAGSVSLGYAPNIGATREISKRDVLLALAAAGLSNTLIADGSSQAVAVRRRGQEVTAIQIREVIERLLADKFSSGRVTAKIVRLDLPESTQVPNGNIDIRVNFGGVRNLFAKFYLPVEVRVDGRVVRSFSVAMELEAFADLLVAKSDIAANARLNAADLRVENRKLDQPLTNYVLDPSKLRGASLLRSIRSGSPITSDMISAATVVKTGDTVRVEAASGSMKIIVSGEARSSGRIGDRVSVKNSQSGTLVQAIVVDEGYVRVIL